METYYEDFEVVHVLDDSKLIDAESYQRSYHCAKSRHLAPGFYVVSWPEQIRQRRFDEQCDFSGPFAHTEAWREHDRLEAVARLVMRSR